jgi:transposase
LKKTKTKSDFQRVQCVWLRAALGLSAPQIAKAVGWAVNTVRKIHSRFIQEGEKALISKGRGGRRHENMTLQEERHLLEMFFTQAETGGVLEVGPIKKAYEKQVGRKVPKSTIYRLLARHGWRKLAPRPFHPDMDPARQVGFKKTSRVG